MRNQLKTILIFVVMIAICNQTFADERISAERAEKLLKYIEENRKKELDSIKKSKSMNKKVKGVLRKRYESLSYVPKMNLFNPKEIGEVNFDNKNAPYGKIHQVINDNELLVILQEYGVEPDRRSKFDFKIIDVGQILIRGVSTEQMTTDSDLILNGVFTYEGTKTYKMPSGKQRTVHIIEKVNDLESIVKPKKEKEKK